MMTGAQAVSQRAFSSLLTASSASGVPTTPRDGGSAWIRIVKRLPPSCHLSVPAETLKYQLSSVFLMVEFGLAIALLYFSTRV